MKKPILGTTTLILVLVISAIGATGVQAQTTRDVNFQWTAPATGAPVAHYVIEQSINGGAWTSIGTSTTNTYTLTATIGDSHSIRVAGVDADARLGTYSEPSDAYTPQLDPPGQPGKPIIF